MSVSVVTRHRQAYAVPPRADKSQDRLGKNFQSVRKYILHVLNSTTRTHATAMMIIRPDVTPAAPEHEQPTVGIIGMGAMGKMYTKYLSEAGWKK
jgi:phosphoglycerate dehydrogenase-like enzyme